MFKHYLKTAWRNLYRNRQSSILNIAGLALGIAVFILIVEYVASEWSANRFHKNYNNLYRANISPKAGPTQYYLPPGYAPAIKKDIPGVVNVIRIADGIGSGVLRLPGSTDKVFREDQMIYVDGNFLQSFTFPLLAGNPSLSEPATLALSERLSVKLFGNTDAVGKTVTVSNQFGNTPYTIASVYEDFPENSDIKAEVLLSLHTLESAASRDENDWADPATLESAFTAIFLQLNPNSNVTKIAEDITTLTGRLNFSANQDKINLQAFADLHLALGFDYPFQTYGSLLLVTVFIAVAVLILIIAWINYVNLSTAQALTRAKDVGVRKVLGARRSQLMAQYLAETFFITLSSVLFAIFVVQLLQPLFNNFTSKNLSISILNSGIFWISGFALVIIGSLLSGSYVAYTISSHKPITSLRGNVAVGRQTFSLRRALVVFQFAISIVFITATIILYSQLKYMNTKSLGMNLDQLLVVKGPSVSSEEQAEKNIAFKNELAQLSFVKKYCASNNVPGIGYNFSTEKITGANPQQGDEKKSYAMFIADDKFFDTYGIQFVSGKAFSKNDAEASWNNVKKVIINEQAATSLGFKTGENITGQKILWGNNEYQVSGVVKDYHHLSLKETVKPTIYLGSVSFGYFTIQTSDQDLPSKLATLKTKFIAAFPGNPFEYFFADEQFNKQYDTDQKLGNVFIACAVIAIFIACLGLFGLSSYTAKQRVKEIGIRKVLGAGVADITALLSKDFLMLVLIAFVIASPVAWWAMSKWLADFAYRVSFKWWFFAVSGFIAAFIACSTISFQAIKAAMANPIKSLRSE